MAWALALVGLFGLTAAYVDHVERQSVIRLAADDIQAAASHLAKSHPFPPANCGIELPPSDFDLLAAALAAVEQLATSRFETAIEAVVVRFAHLSGLPAPDFSLGPGQIRPSTVEAALKAADKFANNQVAAYDRQQIADGLLQDCQSHQLGVLVLRSLLEQQEVSAGGLDRDEVMQIAGGYNAQLTTPSNEAALANYLYRELAYQVFQELKFHHLPGASAGRASKKQE